MSENFLSHPRTLSTIMAYFPNYIRTILRPIISRKSAFILTFLMTGFTGLTGAKGDILKSTLNSSEGNYVILTWLSDIPFRPSMKDEQDFYDKEYDDDNIHVNAVYLSWNEDRSLIKVSQEYNHITRAAFRNRDFWLPLKADKENYYWLVNVLYFDYDKKGHPRKIPQILYGHSYIKYHRRQGSQSPICEAFTDIDEINISNKHLLSVINPMDQLARKIDMGESCDLPKITKAFVMHNSPHPQDGHLLQSGEMDVSPDLILQKEKTA